MGRIAKHMMMSDDALLAFVRESNHIEGIDREPTLAEVQATRAFLDLEQIAVDDLVQLVQILARAELRSRVGMNVTVGAHRPPRGGPAIWEELSRLLLLVNDDYPISAHEAHCWYETLHPFMDGNGRSGRAVWLWLMRERAPLGFLHTWYYQSLDAGRRK